jgi:hypothetical protein
MDSLPPDLLLQLTRSLPLADQARFARIGKPMRSVVKARSRLGTLNAARNVVRQLDDRSYFSFFREISRGLWSRRRRVRNDGLDAAIKRALAASEIEEQEWQPAAAAEDDDSDHDNEPGGRTCDTGRCTKEAEFECQACERTTTAFCRDHAVDFVCEMCERVAFCPYNCTMQPDVRPCYACGARICASCQEACPKDGDAPLCRACYRVIRLGT